MITAASLRLHAASIMAIITFAINTGHAQDGLNLYYGLLHAHTAYSDGSGTPEQAYKKARGAGLDFFAVTPHNHATAESSAGERRDGLVIATRPELYNGTGLLDVGQHFNGTRMAEVRARSVIGAAGVTTNTRFTALYGQEFSTISKGNHVNVLGIEEVLSDPNGDFGALLTTLASLRAPGQAPAVIQLNHPDVQADLFYGGTNQEKRDEMFDDYGLDDHGPHFRNWVAAMDEHVKLVEVLSGPAMDKREHGSFHYRNHHERDYYVYLTQGLHVSPSVGQDNHYPNWGTATPARMGVYAASRSATDLLQAFRENRTFATEDKNLSVKFWVNDRFMGDRITADMDGTLRLRCEVLDTDEPDAQYTITLVSGTIDPQPAKDVPATRPSNGVVQVFEEVAQGSHEFTSVLLSAPQVFFYITVEQADTDKAWTAPVWVSTGDTPVADLGGASPFCWSRNSSVYHLSHCNTVRTISPANLVCGGEDERGARTRHANCPPQNMDPDH
jgi:hypothetical protein